MILTAIVAAATIGEMVQDIEDNHAAVDVILPLILAICIDLSDIIVLKIGLAVPYIFIIFLCITNFVRNQLIAP